MKLLLFSDLHCDTAQAAELVRMAQGVDVAIGAGDFGNGRRGVSLCIDVLKRMPCDTVVVPGNNESFAELQAACRGWERGHVLHGTGVTIQSVPFFGLGGSIPVTPFGEWSYDFTEEEAATLLIACPPQAILVSHSPPYRVLDRASNGKHLGSTTVREFIDTHAPRLVVCGHIHACGGYEMTVGPTRVVNAGPTGIVVELSTAP